MQFLNESKRAITKRVTRVLNRRKDNFESDVPWVDDVYTRLEQFILRGKMIRGSLFLLTCAMFGSKPTSREYDIAAGLEFFHSALLIQDDILDNDSFRRGEKTLYAQYQELGEKEKISDSRFFGNGMAICCADISLFLAYSFIPSELLTYFTKEAQHVGFAQMQDFVLSKTGSEPSKAEIMTVYRLKTARYTFSLPFGLGALLTKQNKKVLKTLEELGEYIGYIFQIRDDELRYFSNEREIGKTVGSDVRENTKTLYRLMLFERACPDEKKKLEKIFGNPLINESDLNYVRTLMIKHEVVTAMQAALQTYKQTAEKLIKKLPVEEKYKTYLRELITYLYTRKK